MGDERGQGGASLSLSFSSRDTRAADISRHEASIAASTTARNRLPRRIKRSGRETLIIPIIITYYCYRRAPSDARSCRPPRLATPIPTVPHSRRRGAQTPSEGRWTIEFSDDVSACFVIAPEAKRYPSESFQVSLNTYSDLMGVALRLELNRDESDNESHFRETSSTRT